MQNLINKNYDIGILGSSSNPVATTTGSSTSSGGGGSFWDTLFGNLGGIGTGAANVITAIGTNRNNRILAENQNSGFWGNYTGMGTGTTSNNTMIYIIVIIVALLLMFFAFKSFAK